MIGCNWIAAMDPDRGKKPKPFMSRWQSEEGLFIFYRCCTDEGLSQSESRWLVPGTWAD